MIKDGSIESVLAGKSRLLLRTNIAKLIGKNGVGQAGAHPIESSGFDVRKPDATGCRTFDEPASIHEHHAEHLLDCQSSGDRQLKSTPARLTRFAMLEEV